MQVAGDADGEVDGDEGLAVAVAWASDRQDVAGPGRAGPGPGCAACGRRRWRGRRRRRRCGGGRAFRRRRERRTVRVRAGRGGHSAAWRWPPERHGRRRRRRRRRPARHGSGWTRAFSNACWIFSMAVRSLACGRRAGAGRAGGADDVAITAAGCRRRRRRTDRSGGRPPQPPPITATTRTSDGRRRRPAAGAVGGADDARHHGQGAMPITRAMSLAVQIAASKTWRRASMPAPAPTARTEPTSRISLRFGWTGSVGTEGGSIRERRSLCSSVSAAWLSRVAISCGQVGAPLASSSSRWSLTYSCSMPGCAAQAPRSA